jgi:hypothetical protein
MPNFDVSGETSAEPAAARLDRALAMAADALADFSPKQWKALCEQEHGELVSALQYYSAMGIPDCGPFPERTLGAMILERLAERHPLLGCETAGEG